MRVYQQPILLGRLIPNLSSERGSLPHLPFGHCPTTRLTTFGKLGPAALAARATQAATWHLVMRAVGQHSRPRPPCVPNKDQTVPAS